MKNVMTLDVGDGVAREIEFINAPSMAKNQVIIELQDERPLSMIAADFEGREKIVRRDNIREDIEIVYSGYTQLTAIQRNSVSGAVRITLSKP